MTARHPSITLALAVVASLAGAIVFAASAWLTPAVAAWPAAGGDRDLLAAPAACVALTGPGQIPAPNLITFDELAAGTSIGEFYRRTHGVSFPESRTTRVIAYDHPLPRSAPMTAMSDTSEDPAAVALAFTFDAAQSHVGMFLGNGGGGTTARLLGFDADGHQVCAVERANVPDSHTAFIGFRDDAGRIVSVALIYASTQPESLDDLYFGFVPAATATPTPTATLTPTRTRTFTPTATRTPTRTLTSTRTTTPTPTRTRTVTPSRSVTASPPETATRTPTRPAPPAAALFVSPTQVAPGGQPAVGGYGFPALADLRLILACPAGTTAEAAPLQTEFDLGATRTDAAGRLRAAVVMPAYPPNPCLLAARQGATTLASAALTVLPALALIFSPQQGPPGTVISFTVRNLVAGDLRLDYAGRAVIGPLRVTVGSFSGSFVVPGDRPNPLGSLVEIRASNLVLGRIVGAASGSFRSQTGLTPPVYRAIDLQLPAADLPPGSDFTITGRISPAPQGPLAQFRVVPVWRKADGRTFPIDREAARISADGAFNVRVRVPSLLAGDPTWPETGDLVGVMLISPLNQPQPYLQAIADLPVFPTFNVKVVDAQTGQLIPSAKVSFEVWKDYPVSANSLPLWEVAGAAATGVSNQVGQVVGTTELTDAEKARIALAYLMCFAKAKSNYLNHWELPPPNPNAALANPPVQGLLLGNSIFPEPTVVAGQHAQGAGEVIPYLLTVDALDAGYGLKETQGQEVTIKHYSLRVNFHLADLTYRDLKGNVLGNPYTVKLAKLAGGDLLLGPIGAVLSGIGAPEPPDQTSLPRFVRYHSTKNAPPGVQVVKAADGLMVVSLSQPQYQKLGAGGAQLYVDGVWKANFTFYFNTGVDCNQFKGSAQQKSPPFYEGMATIPNAHLLAPGGRSLQVRMQLLSGQWVDYNYILQVDDLPKSWFAVPAAGGRVLTWKPSEVELATPWLKKATSSHLLHSDPNDTDETGQLDNRTQPDVNFSQQAEANGHKGGQASGQLAGQVINRDGKGCTLNNCPPNTTWAAASPQQPAANPVSSYTYGPFKEDVVPEVKYNIPGFVAGIPFVASVEVGGVIKYSAAVTYGGEVTVYDDGSVRAKAKIIPSATIGGGMYITAYILAGVITAEKAELTANLRVAMPITYDSATNTLDTGDECFRYFSELKTWWGWLCVPFTEICAYSGDSTKSLFDDERPDGCTVASAVSAAAATAAEATPASPPIGHLNLASNGYGQVLAIWQQTRTSLATSVFDGVTWRAAQTIATGLGSAQPQIAFLTPTRAIAVWTESNLTEAQLPGLTPPQMVASQRIAYAIWNGASWSAAQPLTTPSLGEGGPALAACPEWQPGCPTGGTAVAVWERNLSANLNARNIRLYHARYHDGGWSAPQPVDNAGVFTDILPQVAFVNGTPLAAWVRDSDTDLTDASSRRIALRFLDSGPAFTPAGLPAAIAEVALGVDGTGKPVLAFTQLENPKQLLSNQRPLWVAAGTCTGPTTCVWQPRRLSDAAGRTLYAERPLLITDAAGQVRVIFRGMGFGGAADTQAGDPAGMTRGQGELTQAVIHFATGQVAPHYLTQDAAVNWLPAAAYDPLLDAIVATAIKGQIPTGRAAAAATTPAAIRSPAPDLPIAAAAAAAAPDFALTDAAVTGGPATGGPLRLTARIANGGAAWPGSVEQPLTIAAAWDAAPGIGVSAGQVALASLGPAPFVTITLDLALPPAGLDAAHDLHVAVNPGFSIAEADAANNSQTLAVGGIAAPVGLWAQVAPGSALVFLGWDAVVDRRVAGYRVYRSENGGAWQPVGGSFAPGYVDLTASALGAYRYAVAAYTAEGGESPLSPAISVGERPRRVFLPFVGRDMRR